MTITSDRPRPRAGILDIAPYVGGQSRIVGIADVLKLSSNENPHGPSPKARAAFAASGAMLHRYPSSDHLALREAIGQAEGLDPAKIVCGAGSDELISLLCQGYAGPGDEVLHTEHGFALYRISALAAGATPVVAPERDRVVDVDALIAAAGPRTRLVFIANPANPTGTLLPDHELARLAEGLPQHALLVLDGAYAEFAEGCDGGASLIASRRNVAMTRTFSKLHGLGGLRVGWCFAPDHVIDVLCRVRGPFNLSQTQQDTAAAAIADADHAAWCLAENARLRTWLRGELRASDVECDVSHANFLLARFGSKDSADRCERHMRQAGILVRKVANYGFSEGLRITIGDEAGCRRVRDAVAGWRRAEG
jgi:histidinol-phosphate aminotransferase